MGKLRFMAKALKLGVRNFAKGPLDILGTCLGILGFLGASVPLPFTGALLWPSVAVFVLGLALLSLNGAYTLFAEASTEDKGQLLISRNNIKNINNGAGVMIGGAHNFGSNPGSEPNGTSRPWNDT